MAKSSSKTGGTTSAGAKDSKTKTAAAKAATSKSTASKAPAKAAAKAPAKAAKPAAKPAAKAAKSGAAKSAAPRGGLAQPVTPSKELAKIVGANPLPRSEIVKKIWDYIKANGLQDAKNKREINADATLEPIFGKKKVTMFEMNSHIARNVK